MLLLWIALLMLSTISQYHMPVHSHTLLKILVLHLNVTPLLLKTSKVVHKLGDGNCAYNAVCLTGSQRYTHIVRLLSVHALFKFKPSMLQALINSWFSMANDPIPQAEHKFQEDVHRALTISAWGGEGQFLALSWLFNQPRMTKFSRSLCRLHRLWRLICALSLLGFPSIHGCTVCPSCLVCSL